MAAPALSAKFYSVIAGAGPGTGRAIAHRFSAVYPVILLTRSGPSSSSTATLISEIQAKGGQAHAIATDVSSAASVKSAFDEIGVVMKGKDLACAVYNVGGSFTRKGVLDVDAEADWDNTVGKQGKGYLNFAQSTLPLLLRTVASTATNPPPHPPSLFATGATASLRGGANFSATAAGSFAQRAMVQSVAREFGPQGVHAALVVIDGVIDTEGTKAWTVNGGVEHSKLNPEGIADAFWYLHTQGKSAWTGEMDLRPFVEKF